MDIWLVRHGETDWNLNRRVQGWTDIPLNQTGRDQARRLAASLSGIPFQHIYTSDLSRARDTGKAIADSTGTPLSTTPQLREQYFGQAEGLNRQDKDRRFPNGAPDAETPSMVEARVSEFLTEIAAKHPTGRIVVATHGGVVRAALRWLGQPDPVIHNTSVTCLRVENGVFSVSVVNAIPHLQARTDDESTAGIS
ncbi:histidine phosphatase family protein [Alicyclobacillus dauci]|uniref:Histidine phosphatase family protein n=1 Tax=Alicyclobacillus dauci TaxID=1475485 RepID=A0ABY6Z8U5_9BACL|nr:histidine phosphatase family protein [Alicyclobacillus dauci]WAH38992.1 histidine phosphatase family protein [Alicyclobacillus dauci]